MELKELPKEYYTKRLNELKEEIDLYKAKSSTLINQLLDDIKAKDIIINTNEQYQRASHNINLTVYRQDIQTRTDDWTVLHYNTISRIELLDFIQEYCYEEDTKLDFFKLMNALDEAASDNKTHEIEIGFTKVEFTFMEVVNDCWSCK